jgi:hypothetical protein
MSQPRLLALLLLAASAALGQQNAVPLGARLKLKWQGDVVRFQEGTASHEVAIRDQFHAARLDKVVLQSGKESGDFIYLLLDVTGPSKIPQDSHQCGAGYESDLIWLKLDKDWKLQDAKNFRYESCWATIDMDSPPKWQGDTLSVTVFSVSEGAGKTLTASYSYKRPEDAFKVVEVTEGK